MKRASCERSMVTWSVWHAVWLLTYFPHVGHRRDAPTKSLSLNVLVVYDGHKLRFLMHFCEMLREINQLWSEPQMHGWGMCCTEHKMHTD